MRGLLIISAVLFILLLPFGSIAQEHPEITYVTVIDPENSFDVNIYWKKQEPQTTDSVDIYWGTKVNNIDIKKNLVTNIPWSAGSFRHELNSPSNNAFKYWIQRSGPGSHLTDLHQTIYLSQQNYDTCQQSLTLIWTNYVGWDSVKTYKLYCKEGTQDFKPIYSISSMKDTVFVHTTLEPGMNYRYYVVAESPDGKYKSMSNLFELTTYKPVPADPEKIFIDSVVNSGTSVFLRCQADTDADLHGYIWQKGSLENLHGFDTVFHNNSSSITLNDDQFTNGTYYRVTAIDLCDQVAAQSNYVEPITLNVDQEVNNANLSWNTSFKSQDEKFTITVNIENLGLQTFPNIEPTEHTFNLNELGDDQSQKFCFQVTATSGIKTSISNPVCIIRNPYFEIANAFTPNGDGKNDKFGPIIKNADIASFEFIIYDRYGGRVFSTENQSERWDGSCKGTMVSEGGYLYYIKLTTSHNQTIERKGAVNVVYP